MCVDDDRLRSRPPGPGAHQGCLLGHRHVALYPGLRVVVVEASHHHGHHSGGLVATLQPGEVIYEVVDNLDIFVVVIWLQQLPLLILKQTNLSL